LSLSRDNLYMIIGAVVAVLLQFILAPHIAIGNALPNFVAVFVFLCAIVRCQTFGPVLPFVLGLLYDLACGGVVGAMAFSLTLFAYLTARVFSTMDNDTVFMPIATMAAGILLCELSYGIILLICGYDAGFGGVLLHIILPCFLYNAILAAVLFPLAARLFVNDEPTNPNVTRLR
jgi:rod shape-determining protein MreD